MERYLIYCVFYYFIYSINFIIYFVAVNAANKLLKDADEVRKLKHILEEAEATIKIQVINLQNGIVIAA